MERRQEDRDRYNEERARMQAVRGRARAGLREAEAKNQAEIERLRRSQRAEREEQKEDDEEEEKEEDDDEDGNAVAGDNVPDLLPLSRRQRNNAPDRRRPLGSFLNRDMTAINSPEHEAALRQLLQLAAANDGYSAALASCNSQLLCTRRSSRMLQRGHP